MTLLAIASGPLSAADELRVASGDAIATYAADRVIVRPPDDDRFRADADPGALFGVPVYRHEVQRR